jgi:spore coat protein U-like protein
MKAALGIAAVLALAAGLAAPASAASCLASATPVAFGLYNPTQDALGAGVVTVTCSTLLGGPASAAYSIAMTAGAGSYAARTLLSGSNKLVYNIYTDPGLVAIWGDGSGGSMVVSDSVQASALGVSKTYTAYGRVFAAQSNAAAGLYSDTVIVTISY